VLFRSLTVPVLAFSASDDAAVTGYLITESAARPAAGAAGWRATAPASYTAATDGAHTLYGYAKDAAGNVSDGYPATVTITVEQAAEGLFADDFSDATAAGDPNWEPVFGRFAGRKGAFAVQGRTDNLALVRDVIGLDPFLGGRIETDLQLLNSSVVTRAGIVFDYQDADHYRYVVFSRNHKTLTIGEVNRDGDDDDDRRDTRRAVTEQTRRVRVRSTPKGWHHLSVDVDGATGVVSVYLDGAAKPAVTKTFGTAGEGRVGLLASKARAKALFDNFTVRDASALQ